MDKININEDLIFNKSKQLDLHKAWVPDDLHPKLIRECSSEICYPLKMIFKKSLNDGEIPQDWKKANVIAVFKKGAKHCPLNYRPISLTSIICKPLESIIKDHVVEHLSINNLICPNQRGFVLQRSCLTQQVDVFRRMDESL